MVPILREGLPEVSAYRYDCGSFRRSDYIALNRVQSPKYSLGIQFSDMDVGNEVMLPIRVFRFRWYEIYLPRFPSVYERPKIVEEIFDVRKSAHCFLRLRFEFYRVRANHFFFDSIDVRSYRLLDYLAQFFLSCRFYRVRRDDVRILVKS